MHLSQLRRGKHHSIHLQRAWDKYGEGAFVFELVEAVTLADMFARETHHINESMTGAGSFNCAPVGGSTLGIKLGPKSEAFRQMVSRIHKGKTISPAQRAAISERQKGKTISESHRAALIHATRTRVHSDETRRKLSEAATNISAETRAKRSASAKAAMTPERREFYVAHGRNISDETRAKRAESVRLSWVARRAKLQAAQAGTASPACK
jgi:hypothetical protein